MKRKLTINLVALSFPNRDLAIPLLYIKEYARKDRAIREQVTFNVLQFDQQTELEDIHLQLKSLEGVLFGFSCYVWNHEKILSLAARLKAERKGVKILLGGPQASALKMELMAQHDFIDYIIDGEGEHPFHLLVREHFLEGKPARDISGLVYREGGTVHATGEGEPVKDLYQLDFPQLSEDYAHYLTTVESPVTAQLETTRGCPFSCRYCCWYNNQKVRKFPLEKLLAAVEFLLKHPKIARIYVTDSNAFIFKKRQKEILRFIIEHNVRQIPVVFELNPEFLDDELIDLIAQMGSEELAFGLQSTSKQVLENINRRFKPELYQERIRTLKKRFPAVETYFGLILGLPGDTYESFMNSLEFAVQLRPHSLYIHELLVMPGSEFHLRSKEYGLIFEDKPPYAVLSNGTMRPSEYRRLKHLGFSISLLHHLEPIRERLLALYDRAWEGSLVALFTKFVDLLLQRNILPDEESVFKIRSMEFDPQYELLRGDDQFREAVIDGLRDFEGMAAQDVTVAA